MLESRPVFFNKNSSLMNKIKLLLVTVFFSLILVACGGGSSSSSTSTSSNVTSILAIGDSIGAGFGGTTPWPSLVAAGTGIPVANDSSNGRKASQSVGLVRSQVAAINPSHVVILLGTNDAEDGNVSGAVSAMQQIIAETQAAGVTIIVGTLTPLFRGNGGFFAQQISAGYRSLGAPIAEVEGAFGGNTDLIFDGIHPVNEGQQLIADAFISQL